MKNIVRALTIVLAITGMTAMRAPETSAKVVIGKVATVPVPTCPRNDPDACGMGK